MLSLAALLIGRRSREVIPSSRYLSVNGLNARYHCIFFSVPANLKQLVYHAGVMQGGEKEWNFAFEQFKSTSVLSDKRTLLYAMAGSQEPWLIER